MESVVIFVCVQVQLQTVLWHSYNYVILFITEFLNSNNIYIYPLTMYSLAWHLVADYGYVCQVTFISCMQLLRNRSY